MAATSPRSLHEPLERPPAATTLTVRDLVARVVAGRVRVPSFQRPLRWGVDDVVKLFDSLLRGYPVGALLFWKQQNLPAGAVRIGAANLDVPAQNDGFYIVDGQQRTVALAASLSELDHGGDPRWAVSYWPDSREFQADKKVPPRAGFAVPAAVLGDLRRLGRWFRGCALSEDQQEHVEQVQQRILDYSLPAYVMETDDPRPLRGVFARLNSSGAPMRADEVFDALLGSPAGPELDVGARAPSLLARLQSACDVDGFGEPPRPEALKALLAMSGHDPTQRLERLGEEAARRLVSEADAVPALRRTVAFLQARPDDPEPGPGIPAYAVLPYPVVFVILAKFFHRFPEPAPATRARLAQWVWRGIVTGTHERAAVSLLRWQVQAIGDDERDSLDALVAKVGERREASWELRPFHARSAASRVELLVLLEKGPRDHDGPVHLRSLIGLGERVAREIVRSSEWDRLDPDARALAKTAANRVLLDWRHSGLGGVLRKLRWSRDRAMLESHLLDEVALQMLKEKDYQALLRHRGARLRADVASFLNARAGYDEPVWRPIEHYVELAT
ncbi:MAG: DUF262 domain-containing protein [Myxococcales bacterium]|nr:DUF262 domain-containing protein [Myxococcales bacterium]